MLALRMNLLKVFPITIWSLVIDWLGQGTRSSRVEPDVSIRIRIVFWISHTCRHIHDLPNRRWSKGAFSDLRDDIPYQHWIVENTFDDKNFGKEPSHRLCHGHGRMLTFFRQCSKVTLIDNTIIMYNKHSIRIIWIKWFLPCHLSVTVHWHECQWVDDLPHICKFVRWQIIQWNWSSDTTANLFCWKKFAQMADRPAQLGEAEIVGIRLGDQFIRWRRKTLHPTHYTRVRFLRGKRLGEYSRGSE